MHSPHALALRASLSVLALCVASTGLRAQSAADDITVTATRENKAASDSLSATSVLNRDSLKLEPQSRIGSALSLMPNVATQENPNEPATAINIRGLQDFGRVAVTVDGARQNFQRTGHNSNGMFYLDPAFIGAVDVTRGPVANVYGSGALGGVVSFRTLDPVDILRPGERIAAEVNAQGFVGAQPGITGSVIGAGRTDDGLEALLGASYRYMNPYNAGGGLAVKDTDQELSSALAKVAKRFGDGHSIKVTGQYQNTDFTTQVSTGGRYFNLVQTTNLTAQYGWAPTGNRLIDLKASAYLTSTENRETRLNGSNAGKIQTFRIDTVGGDVNNTSRFDLAATKWALSYGVDGFQDQVKTTGNTFFAEVYTPSGQRSVYGGFAQAHGNYGMFDLITALRFDAYSLNGGGSGTSGQRVSPKITAGVTPVKGLQLYTTYAEGYRAPTLSETIISGTHPGLTFNFIPNPNLRPEIGRSIEGGVNLKYDDVFAAKDKLRGKFAVFSNTVTDFIDGNYNAAAGTYQYVNVASARLYGVEGEVSYDARRWFAGLSGSSTTGDNLNTNQPLTSVYPAKLSGTAGLRFLDEALTVGGRVTWVAAQTRLPAASSANASQSYTLVDLYGSYKIHRDLSTYLSLSNIGDVRYKPYLAGDYFPGFTAKIGLTGRFGG